MVDSVRNALNSNLKAVTIVLSQPLPKSSFPETYFYSKENPVYFSQDYSPKLTIHWSANTTPTPTQNPFPSPSVPEMTPLVLLIALIAISSIVVLAKIKIRACLRYTSIQLSFPEYN